MKLLKEIPREEYSDYRSCLNYLRDNKTIGNEDVEYNGIFHVHWRGPIDTDKVILQIKSTLATQQVKKIYFWIENMITTMTSPGYPKLMQFGKYVEPRIFDQTILNQAPGDIKNKNKIWEYYNTGGQSGYRSKTDVLRWVVLSVYGGVYTDMDTFLLRDVTDIKINNWSSTWEGEEYAEACILKLEKGSNVYEQLYLNNPNNRNCFLMLKNDFPEAYSFRYDNLNFTALPSSFFDILWGNITPEGNLPIEVDNIKMSKFDDFFEKTNKNVSVNNFYNGCFAFHWHNRWSMPEYKDSTAGKLNEDLDRIIKEKYNISPMKIFQG